MLRWSRGSCVFLLVLLAAATVVAQRPHRRSPPRLTSPGAGLHRLTQLPPPESEQRLRQNPDFQRLSPETQQKMLRRLKRLNAMPPQKQKRVIRHLRAFGKLTAQQQAGLRQVYAQYSKMPSADQLAFRTAYHSLRPMTPAARQQYLAQLQQQHSLTAPELVTLRHALELDLPADLVSAPDP